MIGRFLSCRDRFRLRYICGLESMDKWNHRLGYGQMWHWCEEMLAQGMAWEAYLESRTREEIGKYPLQVEEITKWYNVCSVQFPEYVEYWSDHPDVQDRKPLLSEQVFDVPYTLPSGRMVRLRGRWDSADYICDDVTGPGGGVYIQENKTKGDIDELQVERQLKFDLQTMMYLVALDKFQKLYAGKIAKEWPTKGVRYNVVRRPLSGGKGSIRPHQAKSTKTTYAPAESEEDFYERLRRDYLAAEPAYWFFRIRAEISHRDIEVFRKTCLDPILEQMCWWYEEITSTGRRTARVYKYPPMNYRMPFGVYNALDEGGATEYDAHLETGSEAGLRRVEELFTELK